MRFRWIYWTSFVLGLEVFLSKHISPTISECASPIQAFLGFSSILTLMQISLVGLSLIINFRTNHHSKFIDFLFFWMLPVYPIYMTVNGILYMIQSSNYTPGCFGNSELIIWVWIGVFAANELLFILIFLKKILKSLRSFLRRRPRVQSFRQQGNIHGGIDFDLIQHLLDLQQNTNPVVENANEAQIMDQENVEPLRRNEHGGLLPEDIDDLPIRRYTDTFTNQIQFQQNACTICLGDFEQREEVVQLETCNHIFHTECIHGWLNRSSICPVCRVEV